MKKIISVMLAAMMLLSVFAGLNITAMAAPSNGWYKESEDWYYYEKGNAVKGWKWINKKWYYFDEEYGYMYVGYAEIGEDVYCFDKSGAMIANNWYKDTWTYSDEDGTHTEYDWYYLGNSGAAVKGWKQIGGKWYYFDEDWAYMYHSEPEKINDKVYCFKDSGEMVANDWYKVEEKWTDDDGKTHTDTYWWYTNKDGSVVTGWKKINNKWYYFYGDWGVMLANEIVVIKGKIYGFDKSGAMISNGWKKGFPWDTDESMYYTEKKDKLIGSEDGLWYYFDSNGVAVKGWKKINNKWYFFMNENANSPYPECAMLDRPCLIMNTKTGKDEAYAFASSGEMMVSKWFKYPWSEDVEWGYADANGKVAIGWKQISGKWYYFGDSMNGETGPDSYPYGLMMTGWVGLKGKWYYLNEDGSMVTGWKKIDGYNYHFDSNGVCINLPE